MKKIFFLFVLLKAIGTYAQNTLNVDVVPTNVGGIEELKRLFEQELVYPENLLNGKINQNITIHFDLMKDSSVKNVQILKSVSPELDKEALRIFKLLLWVPAIKEREFVTTNWSVTFNFVPGKYAKICRERGFLKFNYLPDFKIDSSGKIYDKPAQLPMYQKGDYALREFIKENLEYPQQAKLSNIQGVVVLSFIVEPSGLVTNIGFKKTIGGGCDQEAIRLLRMIKWYPGRNDNQLIRVKMSFPFYFILNENFRDNSGGEQK